MIRSLFNTVDLRCEGLTIFMMFRICRLECHFNTTVAVVMGAMHEADNTYSIWSTWCVIGSSNFSQ